jgi:hypothetical protein
MFKISPLFALLIALTVAYANICPPGVHGKESRAAFTTVEQEFSEDDALDRFEIDELFLPKLNIDLRALFDWSDLASAYYA